MKRVTFRGVVEGASMAKQQNEHSEIGDFICNNLLSRGASMGLQEVGINYPDDVAYDAVVYSCLHLPYVDKPPQG